MLYALLLLLYHSSAVETEKEGRFKDSKANQAAFAVKKTLVNNAYTVAFHLTIHTCMHTLTHRALEVVQMFLKFKTYVHLQVQNHIHTM